MKDILERDFSDLEQTIHNELTKAYDIKCNGQKLRQRSQISKNLDLDKKISCGLNLAKIYSGKKESIEIFRGNLSSNLFNHLKFKHSDVIRVSNSPHISVTFSLKTDPVKAKLLDFKSVKWTRSEKRLFNSFTIQHTPLYRSSAQYMCLNLPGMKISGELSPLNLRGNKHPGNLRVKMSLGGIEFDKILMCGVLNLSHSKNYNPSEMGQPISSSFQKLDIKYVNLRKTGPKINSIVNRGFFLGRILPFEFSQKLKSMISEVLGKHLGDRIETDLGLNLKKDEGKLDSGDFWKAFYQKSMHPVHASMASVMYNELKIRVTEAIRPSTAHLAGSFEIGCNQAHEWLGSDRTQGLPECKKGISESLYHGFDPDYASKSSGCFDYPFEVVHQTGFLEKLRNSSLNPIFRGIRGNQWWMDGCSFTTTQIHMVHFKYEEGLECISQFSRSYPQHVNIGRVCMGAFLNSRASISRTPSSHNIDEDDD